MKNIFFVVICFICFQSSFFAKAQTINYDKILSNKYHVMIENLNKQFVCLQEDFLNKLNEDVFFVGIIDGGIIRRNIYIIVSKDNIYFFKNQHIEKSMSLDCYKKIQTSNFLKDLSNEILIELRENKISNKGIIYDSPILLLKWKNDNSNFNEKVFYFLPQIGIIYKFVMEVEKLSDKI